MVASLLPFPTRLLADRVREEAPERIEATAYGINLLLCPVLLSVPWRLAVRGRLVRPDSSDEVEMVTRRPRPVWPDHLVMIVVGPFLPAVAVVGYLAVAVHIIVPFRALRHRSSPG